MLWLSTPCVRLSRVALAVSILSFASALAAATPGKAHDFDIPAGDASVTLKQFSRQIGEQLLFAVEAVRGARTQPVKGRMTTREALDVLLAQSGLVADHDAQAGTIAVRKQTDSEKNGPRAAQTTAGDRPMQQSPAQAASEEQSTIKLSPFIIEASEDNGYIATSTLAGSRMKTPLKDVAAQISIFTPELMQDLGVTNLEELYLYSTNVESYLEYAPSTSAGENFGSYFIRNNTRIRGLGGVSNLRNFFPTGFEGDTYNLERVTIASGPNAILFGLGSPGGITDVTLKNAQTTRAKGSVGYRTDSNGSQRYEFDFNQPLKRNVLALRLAGLRDDRRFFRNPSYDNSERLYAGATFLPWKTTTVRVHGEWQRRAASRAAMILQRDFVSPWLDAGKPAFNNAGINANSAAGVTNGRITPDLANVYQRNAQAFPVYIAGNSPQLPIARWTGTVWTMGPHEAAGVRAEDAFVYSFYRPEIFDPEVNTYGPGLLSEVNGRTLNAFVEQRVTRNLVFEFGYMREDLFESQGGFSNNPTLRLYGDPNRFLPDGATLNPNFGKLYIEDNGVGGLANEDREELRLTASYELDFSGKPGWQQWLGRHQFAGLVSRSDDARIQVSGLRPYVVSGNPNFLQPAAETNLLHASRRLNVRYYLDTPGSGFDNFMKPQYGQGPHPTRFTLTDSAGNPFEVVFYDDPAGQTVAAGGNKRNIISHSLAVRNYFLKDRITTFLGWRRDRVRLAFVDPSYEQVQTSTLPDGRTLTGLYPYWRTAKLQDYSFYQTGESFNWGVTAFPLRWLSLHYNQSENFAIQQALLYSPYREPIPGAGGEGRDYGFSLNLLGGKLAFRFNLFENNQDNTRPANNINSAIVGNPRAIELAIQTEIAPNAPKLGMDLVNSNDTYNAIADNRAKGADVELTANFNENWRMFMSVGRQQTQYFIRDVWWRWVEERLPVWKTAGAGWDVETLVGSARTVHQAYDEWVATARDPYQAQSGRITDRQREWRVNGTVSYRFTQGRLKGLGLGGGGRWRSATVLGYPLTKNAAGIDVLDIGRPYMGEGELYIDAFAAYTFRDFALLGRKTRLRTQLNVRNLFDRENLVVANVRTDGTPGVYTFTTPREILFSVTFEF